VAESAVYDCLVQQVMTCLVLTRLSRVDMGARRGQTLTAAETTINNNGDHSRPPTRLLIFAAAMFSASSVACPTCRAVRHRDRDNSQTTVRRLRTICHLGACLFSELVSELCEERVYDRAEKWTAGKNAAVLCGRHRRLLNCGLRFELLTM